LLFIHKNISGHVFGIIITEYGGEQDSIDIFPDSAVETDGSAGFTIYSGLRFTSKSIAVSET